MVEREEFEQMKKEMEECKLGVHKDIKDLKDGHKKLQEAIEGQSIERKTFSEQIKGMIDSVMKEVQAHTKDEMETIKNIHVVLKELVEQTNANTGFISSAKHNEELERRVAEKLDAINKPREEIWHKIKMTAIGVITAAVVGSIITGIVFIVKMYNVINGQ